MALGVTVGRIGDLIVGDHLGKTTHFFLGYRCPGYGVQTASPCAPTAFSSRTPGAVVHQTALYDLFFAGVLLTILLLFERRFRRRGAPPGAPPFDGFLIMVFATGYGCARIVEDFLREDLRRFGLTGSQWVAIATVAVSLFGLLVLRRTPKWGRWDERPPDERPAEEPPPPTLDEQPAPEESL
jgi:prolipoprotein diacylglyceryltransferase